jgi:transposase-like protein
MKLLTEIERLAPREPVQRGEYHIDSAHILIGCPGCGGQNRVHRKAFTGEFTCRFCKESWPVKLTGERPKW